MLAHKMEVNMKISQETMDGLTLTYPLDTIAPIDQILFLDIETTGFTAKTSCVYLIGCVYHRNNIWHSIQWLAENTSEEGKIITSFFQFAANYMFLFHFNGNNFDLPFLSQRCLQLVLPYQFDSFQGIDIYRRINPYKLFLGLPNCKQKTLEQFLGVNRKDVFSASELIGIYREYIVHPSEFSEKALFLHNADDLKGMLEILPMLSYYDLFHTDARAKKVQANTYKDFSGQERKELLIYLALKVTLPKPIAANANHCSFHGDGKDGTLRIPIYEEEMKYYYANFEDYYYLPEEDTALHKSVAAYVDKSYRVQATASSCYTRKYSRYLPQWDYLFQPFFKRDYRSRDVIFELTDELKKDREAFSLYANHVLQMLA
jgi:uncharacterized protein YprB with RNaseH-like and TPR domain